MATSDMNAPKITPNAYYFLIALLPGISCTLFYAGFKREDVAIFYTDFSPLIKMGIATISALIIDMIVLAIRRDNMMQAIKNPHGLLVGLILGLFLPNHLHWWEISTTIAFAVFVSRYVLENYLHAVIIGYIFSLSLFPAVMGLSLFIKNELYTSYMLQINSAFLLGGMFLIYKRLVNWRIPFGSLTVYLSLMLLHKLLYSGTPLSIPLVNSIFTSTTCLGVFFIAPFIETNKHHKKISLLYGVIIGIGWFTLSTYSKYPEPLLIAIALTNLLVLTIKFRATSLSYGTITNISSNALLAPILSASTVIVITPTLTQAITVSTIVGVLYLTTQSISDVIHRYLPKSSMPSLIIVLTAFFSAYIGLSLKVYFPSLSESLDNAIPLLALSSLILSFGSVFNGNNAAFSMRDGLKTSSLFFIVVLLIGIISQFTDMNRLFPSGAFLLLALVALCKHQTLITKLSTHTPNRRVRATGTIK